MASFVNRVWTEDGATPEYGVSGVYTPALTHTTNVDSSTPQLCTYCRVGHTVIVSGQVTAAAGEAGAAELNMSLPVESALGTAYQLAGAGAAGALGIPIVGDADANEALFSWTAADTDPITITFIFSYQQVV